MCLFTLGGSATRCRVNRLGPIEGPDVETTKKCCYASPDLYGGKVVYQVSVVIYWSSMEYLCIVVTDTVSNNKSLESQ